MATTSDANNWWEAPNSSMPQQGFGIDQPAVDDDWFHIGSLAAGGSARVSILPDYVVPYGGAMSLVDTAGLMSETLIASAGLYQRITITGNEGSALAGQQLGGDPTFTRHGSDYLLFVGQGVELPDQILQQAFPGSLASTYTFMQVTATVPAARNVTVTDLASPGNSYSVTWHNDFYLEVSAGGSMLGPEGNQGRYLVTTGNATGQRDATWGGWLDGWDIFSLVPAGQPLTGTGEVATPSIQLIDLSVVSAIIPAHLAWEVNGSTGTVTSPTYEISPSGWNLDVAGFQSLVSTAGQAREQLFDQLAGTLYDPLLTLIEDIGENIGVPDIGGLIDKIRNSQSVYSLLTKFNADILGILETAMTAMTQQRFGDAQETMSQIEPRATQLETDATAQATGLSPEEAGVLVQLYNRYVLGIVSENSFHVVAGDHSLAGAGLADVLLGGIGNDNLRGLAGNDLLAGRDGNDVLAGGAGNDLLDGGAGNDAMSGGTGKDIYLVAQAGDKVKELAGQGTDTVQASVSEVLSANVENLTLTGTGHINGTGNSQANVITGNAGDNLLNGAGGADKLRGMAGNDTMVWGAPDSYDGGSGDLDTLRLTAGNLNLATLADTRIKNTEQIDMTGGANGTLTLQASDVLALSSTTNTLTVLGSAGDKVDLRGAFSDLGASGGFHQYQSGAAIVLIDMDIAVV
jgi:Ca2+-binding RTX toxin-like protein